ncbi:hypothetical protein ScPMuIL_013039 [Solemya velum]
MAEHVEIVCALRTPVGSLNGSLSTLSAHELGTVCIKEALKCSNLEGGDVSEVILGQVLTAAQGQNPARQASINSGIPDLVPACGVNMLCGSGIRSVVLGYQAIKTGDASIVVAGGQESMSKAPHCVHMRSGLKFGNGSLVDSMITDGLTDVFNNYHMGITGYFISKWYLQRTSKWRVWTGGYSMEVVTRAGSTEVTKDEFPRAGCTIDDFKKLKPAFIKDGSGTVTAGNSSGINDGAATLILMSKSEADKRGLKSMGRVIAWAQAGVDPALMGTGPIPATKKALEKAGWSVSDVDLFELNEAFAAQSCAVIKDLGCNPDKVNVSGGAIALGHPIGASGARILVTLLHGMERTSSKRGVAALCVGGGMGIAVCIERA